MKSGFSVQRLEESCPDRQPEADCDSIDLEIID